MYMDSGYGKLNTILICNPVTNKICSVHEESNLCVVLTHIIKYQSFIITYDRIKTMP